MFIYLLSDLYAQTLTITEQNLHSKHTFKPCDASQHVDMRSTGLKSIIGSPLSEKKSKCSSSRPAVVRTTNRTIIQPRRYLYINSTFSTVCALLQRTPCSLSPQRVRARELVESGNKLLLIIGVPQFTRDVPPLELQRAENQTTG